jgi:uncharacterized heparinase superfamily protein
MMPMLRFFRHRDGAFAQFNGMGATPSDLLATVLAYDDARGSPVANAPHSGFQRMEAGEATVIIDTGTPPPMMLSHEAHAGTLSFEFSHGRNRIVVNCGMPFSNLDAWRPVARATAAHSTATLNETSSSRFLAGATYNRFMGTPIVEGPTSVRASRGERDGAQLARAVHDGYASRFGLLHQRSWRLSPDGERLDGEDVFFTTDGDAVPSDAPDRFEIRFHLHPNIKASRRTDGSSVLLVLPGKESWLFSAPNMDVEVEESVFFLGYRRSPAVESDRDRRRGAGSAARRLDLHPRHPVAAREGAGARRGRRPEIAALDLSDRFPAACAVLSPRRTIHA